MLSKEEIRRGMINTCKEQNSAYYNAAAVAIVANLLELISLADNIAVYNAYGFELNLAPTIQYCLELGKNIYQPIAYKETRIMRFAAVELENMDSGKVFYPLDAKLQNEIEWYNIDLILVPLLAASRDGYRLGKGGGYYDATFAPIKNRLNINQYKTPILCGIGFDLQLVDELPHDSWDIKLDYFVSEKRILKF